MPAEFNTFKIAALQACPVFLDLDATVEKACSLIREAGNEGAVLAAFPEAFIRGVVPGGFGTRDLRRCVVAG